MFNILKSLTQMSSAVLAKVKCGQLFEQAKSLYDAGEYNAALPVMKQSAELGSAHAMAHLGVMFMKGLGTRCDWKMAAELLEMTIKIEDYQGTYFNVALINSNLGLIHGIGGYGLRRDLTIARKFLEDAVRHGDEKSAVALQMVIGRKGPFGKKETARPEIQW